MLTTLSITSMNQGSIAPRFDREPRSEQEWVEFAAAEAKTSRWQFSRSVAAIWDGISTHLRHRKPGKLHHA
jgi:hypothetical protein